MSKKDDKVYLYHILESIEWIERYLESRTFEEFQKDKMLQDAVIRELEVIGEAAKNISEELKNKSPNIPWKAISGMRDKLMHHYFGVDLFAVWETATKDIKKLKKYIMKLL